MNTIKPESNRDKRIGRYQYGDLFIGPEGKIYILTHFNAGVDEDGWPLELYMAISLIDGNPWEDPKEYIEDATEGLEFYKHNSEIIIK